MGPYMGEVQDANRVLRLSVRNGREVGNFGFEREIHWRSIDKD